MQQVQLIFMGQPGQSAYCPHVAARSVGNSQEDTTQRHSYMLVWFTIEIQHEFVATASACEGTHQVPGVGAVTGLAPQQNARVNSDLHGSDISRRPLDGLRKGISAASFSHGTMLFR